MIKNLADGKVSRKLLEIKSDRHRENRELEKIIPELKPEPKMREKSPKISAKHRALKFSAPRKRKSKFQPKSKSEMSQDQKSYWRAAGFTFNPVNHSLNEMSETSSPRVEDSPLPCEIGLSSRNPDEASSLRG